MGNVQIPSLEEFAMAIQGYAFSVAPRSMSHFEVSGNVCERVPQDSSEQPYLVTLSFLRRGTTCPTVAFQGYGFTDRSEYDETKILSGWYDHLGQLLTRGPRAVQYEKTNAPLRFRVKVPARADVSVDPATAKSLFAAMRAAIQ